MSNLFNLTSQTALTDTTSTTNDYILPRKLRMEDFLDDSNNKHNNKNHSNNNHSNYNNDINKNQENFGHRRRIKP